MNPILLGRQVEQGLGALVRATLATSSPGFETAADALLAEPGRSIKGPWISVAMPFRQVSGRGEPFPELPLGFAPYLHQLGAFERLRSGGPEGRRPRSTLIATGTGSGKTESYLWPILDHCRARKGHPGIKAILIYPMNALATDQARRIARAIHAIPALAGVCAGIYADAEPSAPTDEMTEEDVITRRQAMWSNPPDILLTNYKMLDYLLIRGRDQPLWNRNAPATLQYLVVDELHTFDGAQGADLALLIRRLKHRLGTPDGHLACVGSSATLGTGEEAVDELRTYAARIFGEDFDEGSVIRESRQSSADVLRDAEYVDWPAPGDVEAALETAMEMTQAAAAQRLARCLFPHPSDREVAALHQGDPAAIEWRILLGRLLLEHLAVHRVIRIIAEQPGPAPLDAIAEGLGRVKALAGWTDAQRRDLAELIVALISWARVGPDSRPQPLFGVRVQTWIREMSRMVATMPRAASGPEEAGGIEILHAHDLDVREQERVLPVVLCGRCGTAAHLGRQSPNGSGLWAPLADLYEDFFEGSSNRLRLIYHERVGRSAGAGRVIPGSLDPERLEFTAGAAQADAATSGRIPVWLHDPTDPDGRVDRTCPACGHAHGLILFGLRAARMTAAVANTLYASRHNEEDPRAKPRLLMFSDSVQDAAQRAAVAEIRNGAAVIRKSLFEAVAARPDREITLEEVITERPRAVASALGPEAFVATFIARDQTWREPYQVLVRTDRLPEDDRFVEHVALRLGWEYFSDLTYRSHTSHTLEAAGIAVAEVSPDRVRSVADALPAKLRLELGMDHGMEEVSAARFVRGFLEQMRRRGAIAHPYVAEGLATAPLPRGGPNYFAAAIKLGLGRTRTLPVPDHRIGAAPVPVSLSRTALGCDPLLRDSATNWYRDWADKIFLHNAPHLASRYDVLFETLLARLEAEGIVRRIDRPDPTQGHGYLLEANAVVVTDRVRYLQCDTCRRQDIALADNPVAIGSPCTRLGCPGTMQEAVARRSDFVAGLLASDRNHRVVGREHTGILDADDRRALETGFISGETPWAPNLVSATPTLEMGIDIGDLSTVLLNSVPPEEANYVQRVGRSGRRDGNSLNVTVATARSHDLQFWEDPDSMLSGQVRPPGVHLGALSVLLRQVAAFTLDRLVAEGAQAGDYGKVREALRQLAEPRIDAFPTDWFHFMDRRGGALCRDFLGMLPAEVASRADIIARIESYLTGRDDKSLIWQVRTAFEEVARERGQLVDLRKGLDAEMQRLRRREAEMTPDELQRRLDDIKRDKAEINQAIRQGIDDVPILRFLTDKGILPNYAFPEEGIKLKSIVARRPEQGRRGADGDNLTTHEYVRPASAALSEFALGQTFYANGREVVIDRLDLGQQDLSAWRFCQRCSHVEHQATVEASAECPQCGDDMWDDVGSRHQAVELKTVIAVTSEDKAAIRDSDDRQQRRYDRTMVPFYDPDRIETSWYAEGGNTAAPFGYEFIAPCLFRDFNFGPRTSAPVGPRIAGRQRASRPFRICRYCGVLQDGSDADKEGGRHQPRCRVPQRDGEIPRKDWEVVTFLMRKFETEAIRMVVPVAGGANDDDIKSFVAGINLGMRRYFAGKVDHIRSTVVEAQLDGMTTVRSLFLYDAVPGGSGYLRQLAEHPDTMRAVIERAASALRDCACVEEGRSGCFRCVKPYRSQFGPGEPDRDAALRMMSDILSKWGDLKRAAIGIDSRIRNYLVESKLEQRFLEVLEDRFGAGSIKPQVLEGGRKGFLLKVSDEGRGRFWTIDPQVQVDRRFRNVPVRRVDFLLEAVGTVGIKPIVVEMDGLKYHADSVADDLGTRLLLIRSGEVRVWTLGWHDLEAGAAAQVLNPFAEDRLGNGFAGVMGRLLASSDFADLADVVRLFQAGSSLDALLRALTLPEERWAGACSVIARTIIGRGRPIDDLPRIRMVGTDGRSFLQEGDNFGHACDGALDLYLSAKPRSPRDWRADIDDCRLLLRGSLPEAAMQGVSAPGYPAAWRGLWRLVNLLQEVPGFHVEFDGLDTLSAPVVGSRRGPSDPRWITALANVDEAFGPLLVALQAAEAEPPDQFGADVTSRGEVVGMVEMGWSGVRLGVVEAPFEAPVWTLVPFDPATSSVIETVRIILGELEGTGA